MSDCEYCDEDFSSEKERLEHELDKHEDELSNHDKEDKKSELNKLEQKEQTKKHNKKKKLQYTGIGVLVLGLVTVGGFYAVDNINLSGVQTSNESLGVGTPVHWHADYQVTVCGEDQVLQGGPMKAHTHGERTFHFEGTRTSKEEATLDWAVDQLGGKLEENSIMGQDGCDGEPANLTVSVNGNTIENHLEYIPRDGDNIEITYG